MPAEDPIVALAMDRTPEALIDDLLNVLGALALHYQVKPGTILRLFTPALLESDDAWPEMAVDDGREAALEEALTRMEKK